MLADTSAGTWIKKAYLLWSPYHQQVSHQRWIWGTACRQESEWERHPGCKTQGRHHQKSKTGVSVAPWKGLMSSKNFLKKKFRNPSMFLFAVPGVATVAIVVRKFLRVSSGRVHSNFFHSTFINRFFLFVCFFADIENYTGEHLYKHITQCHCVWHAVERIFRHFLNIDASNVKVAVEYDN